MLGLKNLVGEFHKFGGGYGVYLRKVLGQAVYPTKINDAFCHAEHEAGAAFFTHGYSGAVLLFGLV